MTRPCTDYRLATSSKSLLSEEVAVELEEYAEAQTSMEEMGVKPDTLRMIPGMLIRHITPAAGVVDMEAGVVVRIVVKEKVDQAEMAEKLR